MKLNDRIKRIAALLHQVKALINNDIIGVDILRGGIPKIHMARRIYLDDPDKIWNIQYFLDLYPEAVTTKHDVEYDRVAVMVDGVEVFILEGKKEE